jgi:hypothetical protein
MLIRVRLNDLLDDAPSLRRERTADAAGLASSFNMERTRRVKPFNSQLIQWRERRDTISWSFKFSPAAQRLTLELTGRGQMASNLIARKNDERVATPRSG